jgi:hypothetical protein
MWYWQCRCGPISLAIGRWEAEPAAARARAAQLPLMRLLGAPSTCCRPTSGSGSSSSPPPVSSERTRGCAPQDSLLLQLQLHCTGAASEPPIRLIGQLRRPPSTQTSSRPRPSAAAAAATAPPRAPAPTPPGLARPAPPTTPATGEHLWDCITCNSRAPAASPCQPLPSPAFPCPLAGAQTLFQQRRPLPPCRHNEFAWTCMSNTIVGAALGRELISATSTAHPPASLDALAALRCCAARARPEKCQPASKEPRCCLHPQSHPLPRLTSAAAPAACAGSSAPTLPGRAPADAPPAPPAPGEPRPGPLVPASYPTPGWPQGSGHPGSARGGGRAPLSLVATSPSSPEREVRPG